MQENGRKVLKVMPTLERLIGQRLMVGFNGTDLNEDLRHLIKELSPGGIILFKRNLESPDQIQRLCRDAQQYVADCGLPPLFIAIDQEGGCVSRLPAPYTQFEGNPAMRGEEDARRFAEITGAELSDAGFNMNMAPVLDIAPSDCNSIMAERAFGPDPGWVSRLGNVVIEGLQRQRIMAVAKHFPGIGRTVLDSHTDLPSLAADYESLMAFDLLPFREAIKHRVVGMMLSHIIYEGIDPKWPASLSRRIARDLLRRELNFDGLVLTDDLDMGAISGHFDIRTAIERVMHAGIDIALICHSIDKMQIAFEHMLDAVSGSNTLRRSANESFDRIMKLKGRYLISIEYG
jgi:beta-N-acetylhexosaminidase